MNQKHSSKVLAVILSGTMLAGSFFPIARFAADNNGDVPPKAEETIQENVNVVREENSGSEQTEIPSTPAPSEEETPVASDTPVAPETPDTPDNPVSEPEKPVEQHEDNNTVHEQDNTNSTQSQTVNTTNTNVANPTPNSTVTQNTSYNYYTRDNFYQQVDLDTVVQDYTPHHYTQNLTTEMFIAQIGEQARQIGQRYNIYASVMIAQAILESGSGSSGLALAPNNNLFGIKGVWKDKDGIGHSKTFATMEDDGTGSLYSILDSFRVYNTQADSLEDYANLITGMPSYYSGVLKSNAKDYKDACVALQGTYATDTTYASKLIGLIETYDLTRFDKPLDYKISGTIYDPGSKEADDNGYRQLTMDDYSNLLGTLTSQLGIDYVWGGASPEQGFDCSGLVSYVYKKALGIDITRTADTQALQGETVKDLNDLRPGDLLFWRHGTDVAQHVGMYIGDGYYIQAPTEGQQVKISAVENNKPDVVKRIINFVPVTEETKVNTPTPVKVNNVKPALI